jgi:hypothetical protein
MHSIHSLESLRVKRMLFRLHPNSKLTSLIVTCPALLATAKCFNTGSNANALDYFSAGNELIELAPPATTFFTLSFYVVDLNDAMADVGAY